VKVYITRHGQVEFNAEYYNGDASLPKGELLLSDLGRKQAVILGRRMKELGFQGKIYASPLLRTMETAELIANETGSSIVPVPWFQEIFGDQAAIDAYRGYTIEELRKHYFRIAEDAVLEYPWWVMQAETQEMVKERVIRGLNKQLNECTEDILLVGHGASAGAAHEYLNLKKGGFIWNCGLGMYDTEYPERNYGNDISHLPETMVSTNRVMGVDIDFDADLEKVYPIDMPVKLRGEKRTKLLHIGDAHSASYLYYKQLIHTVKPEIIVYTGDTADEVKIGKNPEVREEYLTKVQVLLKILKESGSKVYWVPGNNDLPQEIGEMAPFMEIVQPDTVLNFEGVDICLAHSREQITKNAEVYLYGHGRRAANFEQEKGLSGSESLCLNVMWNSYVCVLPEKELYLFKYPWKNN